MNSNTHNICDDWGWYVDIENNLLINSNKSRLYIGYNNNKLSKIEEYDYFRYIEDIEDIEDLKSEDKNGLSFYTIGSTTLISALLTYSILFLII
jgi:hypothetical protein